MEKPFIFTVKQLTRYIKALLERDRSLQQVWVRGEISNFLSHSSGHVYFTLKDENSQLRCVLFRDRAELLDFQPEDGLQVLAQGAVSVYERSGQYQLLVEELRPHGRGMLYQRFEALKQKLAAEGLFDESRKRPLPQFPQRIALLTSPDGAVFHDFVSIVRKRWPAISVLLIPTMVSGEAAAPSIAHSLSLIERCPGIDLAVLARGGGSIEELWGFNTEQVARAIAASPVPVVSAVGHETDFTMADFVADLRAATPSAAAQLVVPDLAYWDSQVGQFTSQARQALARRLQMEQRQLDLLLARQAFRSPWDLLAQRKQRLDDLVDEMARALRQRIQGYRQSLANWQGKLTALDPKAILNRGYSLTRKLPEGNLVRKIAQVTAGDQAEVLVSDGRLLCRIESKEKGHEG